MGLIFSSLSTCKGLFIQEELTGTCPFPKDIVEIILSLLPPDDLVRAGRVCRKWRQLSHNELLWQQHYLKRFTFQKPTSINWRQFYISNVKIQCNFQKGVYQRRTQLLPLNPSALKCSKGAIFIGTRLSDSIVMLDENTGKEIKTFKPNLSLKHAMAITVLAERLFVAYKSQAHIRVFDIERNTLLHSLNQGHESRGFATTGDILYAADCHGMVCGWNAVTFACTFKRRILGEPINSISADGNTIIVGGIDSIQIFSVHPFEKLRAFYSDFLGANALFSSTRFLGTSKGIDISEGAIGSFISTSSIRKLVVSGKNLFAQDVQNFLYILDIEKKQVAKFSYSFLSSQDPLKDAPLTFDVSESGKIHGILTQQELGNHLLYTLDFSQ